MTCTAELFKVSKYPIYYLEIGVILFEMFRILRKIIKGNFLKMIFICVYYTVYFFI